jgi:lipoate-protein ligase B
MGTVPYQDAWQLQDELAASRLRDEIPDTLLLLQHPPTLTLGRGADRNNIVAQPERLANIGVTVVESNRGGDVTYHGPGQIVGYPILRLDRPPYRQDLHWYLRSLEETLILALGGIGIEAGRFPGYTGVWTAPGTPETLKIAAIGIRTSRWVTQHGFALNVTSNLSHFNLIVPCGIQDYGVTSVEDWYQRTGIQDPVVIDEIQGRIVCAFEQVFGVSCEE